MSVYILVGFVGPHSTNRDSSGIIEAVPAVLSPYTSDPFLMTSFIARRHSLGVLLQYTSPEIGTSENGCSKRFSHEVL